MNVSAIAATATRLSEERVASQAGVLVLKKAMDVQEAGALALLAALPTPPAPPTPAPTGTLGGHIDTYA